MTITYEAAEWIQKAAAALSGVERIKGYIALEGLPCAGKTTTIERLAADMATANELRLAPSQESCLMYLHQEPARAQDIRASIAEKRMVLGDRSILSTLAHKAALITYTGPADVKTELEELEHGARTNNIILPNEIVFLQITPEISRERQAIRDRDILEGRLWYDKRFLNFFATATNMLVTSLYERAKTIDSQQHNLDAVVNIMRAHMEEKYAIRTYSKT